MEINYLDNFETFKVSSGQTNHNQEQHKLNNTKRVCKRIDL
jgi:hypothetical protein